ncbi:hypothetical protein AAE478_003324, partial [Parahypoxylon ruwenzoriense]
MAQTTTPIYTSRSKPIPIPILGHSKKNSLDSDATQSPVSDAGSDVSSYYESALDEDDNAYDMSHLPSHHRRNALSFQDGFEFP